MPIQFCWNNEDARILACEVRRLFNDKDKHPPTSMSTMHANEKLSSPTLSANGDQRAESHIVILFTTNDVRNAVKPMEVLNLDFEEQLLDMFTPHVASLRF